MADNNTYGTVVECIIGAHVKERILQDTCREADFICGRIVISVYGLRGHEPLGVVNRLLVFALNGILKEETAHCYVVLKQTLLGVDCKL